MLDHAFVRSGAAASGGMSLGFSGLHASTRTCSALNHGIGSCACVGAAMLVQCIKLT